MRVVLRWALVGILGAAIPFTGAAAQTSDGSVTADADGWWSQSNGGIATPNGPVTPPVPRNPLVPEGSLPVSAMFGEPQTVAAVGITVPEGMQATRLVMTLALADRGGESNPSQAELQACPITSFWGRTEGGKWADRPEADCTQAAAGERNDDGSWSFDLTQIAALWADDLSGLAPNGVLLTEVADPPATFQIAFAGLPDGISFDAELAPAPSGSSAFDLPADDGGGGFGSGGFGGGSFGDAGSFDVGSLPAPSAAAPSTPSPGAAGSDRAAGASGQLASSGSAAVTPGDLTGDLPLGLLLLVPLALLVAVLAGQALAPARERAERPRRQGGVGKALAAGAARSVRPLRPEAT